MTDETETTEVAETETTVEEPENISDLFNDDETPETESETETGTEDEPDKGETETEETETTEAETKADDETETEETDSEPPSEEEGSVPRKALLDERRKRQELEDRLKQFEPEDDQAPDPTDDPKAYEQYLRQKWEKEKWEEKANLSRDRMMETHPDFEEKERYFIFLANQDPDLIRQMNQDPDPAAFAYNKAKEPLDELETAIEKRVTERLKKEGKIKEEVDSSSAETASRVSDLTSATGAGKNKGEDPIKESTDPEDVFDDLKY